MIITIQSTARDIHTFANKEGFSVTQNRTTGVWTIQNTRIGEDFTTRDFHGVVAFFVGYSQAQSRYL